MKKFYDIAPFIMLVITAVSGICSEYGWYHKAFNYLPDAVGYSIFTNLVMLRVYRSPKFCHATRISVYGLLSMNVINLFTLWFGAYNPLYDLYVFMLVVIVIIHLMLKKKNVFTSRYSR